MNVCLECEKLALKGHHAASDHKKAERIHCWQAVPRGERDDLLGMLDGRGIGRQQQTTVRHARAGLDGSLGVGGGLDLSGHELNSQR